MKQTNQPKSEIEWEEKLYEIIAEVNIPNHPDWGSGDDMSLFDITMNNGKTDEGMKLAEKLNDLIIQIIAQSRQQFSEEIFFKTTEIVLNSRNGNIAMEKLRIYLKAKLTKAQK